MDVAATIIDLNWGHPISERAQQARNDQIRAAERWILDYLVITTINHEQVFDVPLTKHSLSQLFSYSFCNNVYR